MSFPRLIIVVLLILILTTFVYGGLKGAPWVPTRRNDVKRFLKLAKIKSGETVIDLGCGDGRLICEAVKQGGVAEGFEVSVIPCFLALLNRQKLEKEKRKNLKIHFRNFWKKELGRADIVYIFQTKKAHAELGEKLKKELKKGARVITYVWPIEEWKEQEKDVKEGMPKMYLYKI